MLPVLRFMLCIVPKIAILLLKIFDDMIFETNMFVVVVAVDLIFDTTTFAPVILVAKRLRVLISLLV